MRIAIVGQQDFGKAVLEAFLARNDEVAGVFCAPEKPGARPDALRMAAQEKGVSVFQFASLKSAGAIQQMKALNADIYLPMHPEMYFAGKVERIKAGEMPHPLFDPNAYAKLIGDTPADDSQQPALE